MISEGGECFAGSVCDICKNIPANSLFKVTKRDGPLFLHRTTDRKARLKESFARRFLGTSACPERFCLGERSKVPGENLLLAYN